MELNYSVVTIDEESTWRKVILVNEGETPILFLENDLGLALNMVMEWPESFLSSAVTVAVCFPFSQYPFISLSSLALIHL